jgi:MFS superfamily sulfate permease-like transporter
VADHEAKRPGPEVRRAAIYRIQDRLFFANAHFVKRRVWAAADAAPRPVRHLVPDAASISGVDASAVQALREVHTGLTGGTITCELGRATDELHEQLEETGIIDLPGEEHVHPTVTAAVKACAPDRSSDLPSEPPSSASQVTDDPGQEHQNEHHGKTD